MLHSVSVVVEKGDRIGLVGPNGSGKSTLLRILTGALKQDTGDLEVLTDSIGYLAQLEEGEADTIEGALVDPRLRIIDSRMRELESEMALSGLDRGIDLDEVAMEYNRLQEELVARREHLVEGNRKDAMERMGIADRSGYDKMDEMSGGERTKVRLARMLMQAEEADLLIMDEPTSHLDIEGVETLEDNLLGYHGAVIVVSHDRYFLDRVATCIWDLDKGVVREFKGNYSDFVKKKALELEKLKVASEKNRRERERLVKVAEEQHLRNWFGTTHKTTLRRVERMGMVEGPEQEDSVSFGIEVAEKHSKGFVQAKDLVVVRGNRKVLDKLDMELNLGDKLGIFGPNGSGKTTLLKVIMKELGHLGELWVSPAAKIGYFSQGHDGLDERLTPEEQLLQALGKEEKGSARSLLARLLFDDLEVKTPIGRLSGGERAKVTLALLICERRNLLLLDEPTNYLDTDSREAVESALREYPGTLVLVTHDRYLMDAVCNKVAEMRNGRLRVFNGTYSQMKGMTQQETVIAEAQVYRVVLGFTDWTTRKKLKPGDTVAIAPSELENYRWALDNGKLKRLDKKEYKKIKKPEAG
ncbi:MAG TPA: ABC-F family ATP-binding cassette domain-containing protein [Methanomassiliicoccales archaeon]|nr:ABC-F family ATP-binding cassette domain-containing protein [Methanomassiliicoccales archaeon]